MPNYDINDLLDKFKSGNITPSEQAYLETWYLNYQTEPLQISQEEIELAKDRVWATLKKAPPKLNRWYWFSSAAGIFIIAGLLWLNNFKFGALPVQQVFVKPAKVDFKPGGAKATLTLSNGEEIELGSSKNGKLAKQGNIVIQQAENGKIIYKHVSDGLTPGELTNKINTPRGGEYNLVLSDGTKVWLNASSSLTYPVDFKGNTRQVSITGEAYFEVAHDKTKPFIVSTADQHITVLGTHFNVSAYPDDDFTSTALVQGKVFVKNTKSNQSATIVPGEVALSSSTSKDLKVAKIDIDEILAWRNGYFQFDNQNIYSIMKIIGRWYDVDVEYQGLKNQERFGGTFSRGKNLSASLSNLEKIGKVHFKITPKKIIVTD